MISCRIRYCPLCRVDGIVTLAGSPFTNPDVSTFIATRERRPGRTDVLLVPGGIARFETRLLDLEPLGVRRVVLVAGSVSARRHVGHDRTNVVRPLHATSNIQFARQK